ncbi:MAG: TonB-dependent receptor [Pseudomonadota bacterium]
MTPDSRLKTKANLHQLSELTVQLRSIGCAVSRGSSLNCSLARRSGPNKVSFLMPLVLALTATAGVSSAAEEQAAKIEEMIVTARKVEEKIQDVPASLRVFSMEEMQKMGFDSISDSGMLLPGVTYDIGGFVQDTRPAMRGMQNERGRPSVAVLIDYIDASTENLSIPGGSSALYTRLLDVERIEIVKGPQTLLYGRNAFGGAINIVTQRPGFEWEGRVDTDIGNIDRQTFGAGVSGPIIDDVLAFRASVASHNFDGFYDNPNTGADLGTEDSLAGSLALLFTPTDRIQVYARYQQSDEEYSQPASALVTWDDRLPVPGGTFAAGPPGSPRFPCPDDLAGTPDPIFNACTRGVVLGELDAQEADIDYSLDPATGRPFPGMEQTQRFGSLQADYEIWNGTLTYLAGFMNNQSSDRSDTDYTDFAVQDPFQFSLSTINLLDYDFQHQSHELRHTGEVGNLSWTVGGAAYLEDAELNNASLFWTRNPDSLLGGPPFFLANEPNPGARPNNIQSRDTEHYSAFLSLGYQLNEQWRITGEGRYSHDTIDYRVPTWNRQQISLLQQIPVDFCPPETDDRDVPQSQRYPNVAFDCFDEDSVQSKVFTPRVLLEYQPGDDQLYYASITTGFKPGGFAANEAVILEGQRYNEEEVTTYEVGARTEWFDNTLRLNGAVYFNDYRDQQIGIQQIPPGSVSPVPGITNAARVEVFGVELDATWLVTDQLQFALAYAYTDAVFEQFVQTEEGSTALNKAEAGNIDGDFSGNDVGKNPKHAASASLDYFGDIEGSSFSWFAGATGLYRSKRYMDESNLNYLPSFYRVNLRAGVENDRYRLIAYVDNVFDGDEVTNGQRVVDLGNPDGFAPGRGYLLHMPLPRAYGVRFQVQF